MTKAASVIGISQPAISNVLAELRGVFDDRLFVRSGRRISPTPKATQLAELIFSALSPLACALDLATQE